MRRRTFLAGLVAVPVAVACDPRGVSTVRWPVRPGGTSTSVPPTTSTTEAPVADLATLDEWHYVGEAGEPAFLNSWSNWAGNQKLSFRLREAGIVDIAGYCLAGTPGSTVFTLPTGYVPTNITQIPITGVVSGTYRASVLQIDTSGNVKALRYASSVAADPDEFCVSGSFFLTGPATA